MKKVLLSLLLIAATLSASAQFKLNSDGSALVGSNHYSFYNNTPAIKMEVHSPLTGTTGRRRVRHFCALDGGTLQYADITMIPGSTLIMRNNGRINLAPGINFDVPKGVIINIESGEIN